MKSRVEEQHYCVYELGRKIKFLDNRILRTQDPEQDEDSIYWPTPDLCYLDYLYESTTVTEAINKTKKLNKP